MMGGPFGGTVGQSPVSWEVHLESIIVPFESSNYNIKTVNLAYILVILTHRWLFIRLSVCQTIVHRAIEN